MSSNSLYISQVQLLSGFQPPTHPPTSQPCRREPVRKWMNSTGNTYCDCGYFIPILDSANKYWTLGYISRENKPELAFWYTFWTLNKVRVSNSIKHRLTRSEPKVSGEEYRQFIICWPTCAWICYRLVRAMLRRHGKKNTRLVAYRNMYLLHKSIFI